MYVSQRETLSSYAQANAAGRWQAKAVAIQNAVSDKLLRDGPHDLAGETETPIRVESASDYIALFGGCATPEQAETLVRRLRKARNWTPFPVPRTKAGRPWFWICWGKKGMFPN